MTPQLAEIVEKIISLRELTKLTGMVTRKSQTSLLAPLSEAQLAEVCLALHRYEKGKEQNVQQG